MKIITYLRSLDLRIWQLFYAIILTVFGLWLLDASLPSAVMTMICALIAVVFMDDELAMLAEAEPNEEGNPYPENKVPLLILYFVILVASIAVAAYRHALWEVPLIFFVGWVVPVACHRIKKRSLTEQQ